MYKILIVDDDKDTADSLQLMLELHGFEAMASYLPGEGLAIARRELPQVILCDLGMPLISGLDVARALKSDPATRQIILIGLTGYARCEDELAMRDAGFDQYLVKPVPMEKLLDLLKTYEPQRAQ